MNFIFNHLPIWHLFVMLDHVCWEDIHEFALCLCWSWWTLLIISVVIKYHSSDAPRIAIYNMLSIMEVSICRSWYACSSANVHIITTMLLLVLILSFGVPNDFRSKYKMYLLILAQGEYKHIHSGILFNNMTDFYHKPKSILLYNFANPIFFMRALSFLC